MNNLAGRWAATNEEDVLCGLRASRASTRRSRRCSVRSVLLGRNFVARREDFFACHLPQATCHSRQVWLRPCRAGLRVGPPRSYTEPRRTLGHHPPVDATLSCRGVRGKRRGKGAKFRGNKATIWLRISNLTKKWPENKANLSVALGHGERRPLLQPKNKANWFNRREGMAFGAIIAAMGSPPSTYRAHRCSFRPDRVDPY